MTSKSFTLTKSDARQHMVGAWDLVTKLVTAGKRVRVTVSEAKSKRSTEQNDLFHSICHELSQQRAWAGRQIDTEGWKRLLVDAWARATDRNQGQVVPSLDGHSVVNLGIQTRRLPVGEMSELIEFAQAYCAEHDVELHQ